MRTSLVGDLYKGMGAWNLLRRCANGGRWILAESGYNARYCIWWVPGMIDQEIVAEYVRIQRPLLHLVGAGFEREVLSPGRHP